MQHPVETCTSTDFQHATYEVLYECVGGMRQFLASTGNARHRRQMTHTALRFGIVGQLPLKIATWLRDFFSVEQQVVTSMLTINGLFPKAPAMVGTAWRDSHIRQNWQVTVDDFGASPEYPIHAWQHRCLLVLNESKDWALTRR